MNATKNGNFRNNLKWLFDNRLALAARYLCPRAISARMISNAQVESAAPTTTPPRRVAERRARE